MTFTKEQLIEDLKASKQNASGMFEIGEETICALMSMLTATLHGAEHNRPDAVDANLVEALRLVQCMLEDYRERNYGDAERWIRHIDTHMSDYSETHGDDAYSVLHDLLPASPQQEV